MYFGVYYVLFNCGLNCMESVNFVFVDWFLEGSASVERNWLYVKCLLFSYDELVCRVVNNFSLSIVLYLWFEIVCLYVEEVNGRVEFFAFGVTRSA